MNPDMFMNTAKWQHTSLVPRPHPTTRLSQKSTKMASPHSSRSQFDFVDASLRQFFDPVTSDLLQEPHQTLCCGKHLSHETVTKLQQDGEPCPLCKKTLETVPDKFFHRTINQLQVYCSNKSLGCEWVGELGSLEKHKSKKSVEGECQFVTVTCPYSCGGNLQRCQLKGHKIDDCPNRPFTCEYCGYEATYKKVSEEHLLVCERYPIECPNKSLGCQWVAVRGDLNRHLNQDSLEGECQFVKAACPYSCSKHFLRCQLEEHKVNDCPHRPFICPYCNYKATYDKANEHWSMCENYPMKCPHQCGENAIKKQDLLQHLNEACPLQTIKCKFQYAGCEVECQRRHMQAHLDENVKIHLDKVSHQTEQQQSEINTLQRKTQQQQSEIDTLLVKTGQQQTQIATLQCESKQQQQKIEQNKSQIDSLTHLLNQAIGPVFGPPLDIVMTSFLKLNKAGDEWYSSPFYSHVGGYKMCLRVDASGHGTGKGTHVSVFVYLMRGEHDDQLQWPFRGDVTIRLLNQRRNEGHWEKTLLFDDRINDESASRTTKQEKALRGWGRHQFIPHAVLCTPDKEYLKHDSLKFRILKVAVKS